MIRFKQSNNSYHITTPKGKTEMKTPLEYITEARSKMVEDIQEGVGSFLKNRAKIKELQKKIDHYGELMDDAMDDGDEGDWVDAYDKRKALMDQLAQLAGKKK